MAGHMGDERVTLQNLEVVSTDDSEGLIFVKGGVPGAAGGWVLIQDAAKRARPDDAPYPAQLRGSSTAEDTAEAAPAEAAEEAAPADEPAADADTEKKD